MSPKMVFAFLSVFFAVVSLVITGYISYIAFDSLNILDGWARDFAICLATDAISSVLYIITKAFRSCSGRGERETSDKSENDKSRTEGILLGLKIPLLVWSVIIWVHTADTVAKSLAMVYAICTLTVWVSLGVIAIAAVCVGYNKVVPVDNA